MNTENVTKMTQALAARGHESIITASGEILIATSKAKLHAAEKVRTILPSTAKFDGEKWATTYEGQYITDPAELARLREEAKSNEETALRLGKISGKGDKQEAFLKSGPVVELDKKAISEYMKGLDKTTKARKDQATQPEKPKAPAVKQNEGEAGKKTEKTVAKRKTASVKTEESEAGKKTESIVAKRKNAKADEGKNFQQEAPKPAAVPKTGNGSKPAKK